MTNRKMTRLQIARTLREAGLPVDGMGTGVCIGATFTLPDTSKVKVVDAATSNTWGYSNGLLKLVAA